MPGHGDVRHHMRELEKAKAWAMRLEGLLCRSEAKVHRSVGVKALERLAEELATYFRALLGEVSRHGRSLQGAMEQEDPLRKQAQLIVAHAEAGRTLANRLLAFSEGGKVHPILLNVNHYVQEVSHLISGILKRRITLRTVLAERDLLAMIDPARMGQVLVALTKRGSDLVCDGGVMTIRTDLLPVRNGLIPSMGENGCALLSISSSNVSLEPACSRPGRAPHARGLQLGLSIVRRIIEQHRGAFRIHGQAGEGVEYSIYLPVLRGS